MMNQGGQFDFMKSEATQMEGKLQILPIMLKRDSSFTFESWRTINHFCCFYFMEI